MTVELKKKNPPTTTTPNTTHTPSKIFQSSSTQNRWTDCEVSHHFRNGEPLSFTTYFQIWSPILERGLKKNSILDLFSTKGRSNQKHLNLI